MSAMISIKKLFLCQKCLSLVYFVMLLACVMPCSGQTLTMMSYNVENAFDALHDEGKDDYEYVEGGMRHWTYGRLYGKLTRVAKVIAAADELRPVDLVALCEVENDSVMQVLTRKTALASIDYRYVITHSLDARGVDVALMYNRYTFHPVDTQCLRPSYVGAPTRDVLHVAGTVMDGDTLDVYVVHLPSKLGGAESYNKGMAIARAMRANIDSVMSVRTNPRIAVMGDFNADSDTPILRAILGHDLTDVSVEVTPGTYCYHGAWQTIDHILVSHTISHGTCHALSLPFMMEWDRTYHVMKPKRSFTGYKYNSKGISDHLPLVYRLSL